MSSTSTRITIAVSDYWILGTMPLENSRIQDVLSDPSTNFVQLCDAEIHKLTDCDCVARLPNVYLPKDKIEFILKATDVHEAPDKRWNNRKLKQRYGAFAIVGDHCAYGYLHLDSRPSDARYVLSHQLGNFFPLTDATVRFGGRGARQLNVPLLFANTEYLNCFDVGDHINVEKLATRKAAPKSQIEDKNLAGLLKTVQALLNESRSATEANSRSTVS